MSLSPPRFWSAPAGRSHPLALALAPLGAAYGRIGARRIARAKPSRASVPVVCVGNATVGGVGKTPFCRLVADVLKGEGHAPHIVTRGYGGRLRGPVRVLPTHRACEVGDEARLLASTLPVWVAADRPAGAAAAAEDGAGVVVLDDGFQNPSLSKDLSFLLVDGQAMFGNGRLFPAGPLRERPEDAARRADVLVAVGGEPADLHALARDKPLLTATLVPDFSPLDAERPVLAFAGIGRPERFFGALAEARDLVGAHDFPDHHPYTEADAFRLLREADEAGAQLATTEKDAMRLPPSLAARAIVVPARMVTQDLDRLRELLRSAVAR